MHLFRIWRVLFVFGTLVSALCANDVEYEGNYADNYDNEIPQDQQEGESEPRPCHADFSRWDKLFISLEDSQMRQNMLLESVELCCGGMRSLRMQMDKLANGTCQQNTSSLVSACRAQAEQSGLRLQHGLTNLREEMQERERTLNATLQMILQKGHEENTRLKRLEEAMLLGSASNRNNNQPTPRPGGTPGIKPFLSGLKEQEVTLPMDIGTMERALVAIATELQRVHLQLSKVIEQAGTLRKDRGDT